MPYATWQILHCTVSRIYDTYWLWMLLHWSGHIHWLCQKSRDKVCRREADNREPSNPGSLYAEGARSQTNGKALCIPKQAKEDTAQSTRIQALAAKLPNVNTEMTPQQFRKFRIAWDIFSKMTNMPSPQFNIHQYNCADEAVQNAIINTHSNFFTTDPDKLLDMVEVLVTQRSNPIIHCLALPSISQDEGEPIQNYLVRLRVVVIHCSFSCPLCEHDLFDIYIRGKRQCSAHPTRPYLCSWTQWPAIQKINRHHTKWIREHPQPHCTRDPRVLGGEVPPQRGRWVSALGPQDWHPHLPACKCTT